MKKKFLHKVLLLLLLFLGIAMSSSHLYAQSPKITYVYDALNRRTGGSYADGSTTDFVYDAVGRLIEGTDSVGGTIGNQYDTPDRLVAQITDLGTVSYGYHNRSPGERIVVWIS